MKRKFKLIVPSFLTLIFCLLLIAGSTFAIFSSQDQASIEVTSGKVHVTASLTDLAAFSAQADDSVTNTSDNWAGEVTSGLGAGKYKYVDADKVNNQDKWFFATKGTAELTNDKTLILNNIVPGDKVTLKLTLTNSSNVDVKYRVRLNATEDNGLLDGLTVEVGSDTLVGSIKNTEWKTLEAEDTISSIPLAVYLPIDAGNEYQEKTAKLRFTVEMVQGNAKVDEVLDLVNGHLTSLGNTNKTMWDAIQDAKAWLALLENAGKSFAATNYVWNMDTDQFYAEDNVVTGQGFESRFFKAYTEDSMPALADQKFGIYATGAWTNPVNVVVGFDAGDATGISSVSYVRNGANDKAQEVVIRTNSASTSLTIDAAADTVKHYGAVGSLNIIAVANMSYHEYGQVAFAEIATGRIVLESGSEVNHIHLNTSEVNSKTVFNNITVAKASDVQMPEFSRDPIEINETEGTLVVALQNGTETTDDKDYVWLTAVGIYEQVVISDKDSLTAQDVEKIYAADSEDQEKKDTAQQIANNITFSEGGVDYKVTATKDGDGWTYEVKTEAGVATAAFEAAESGNTVTITNVSTSQVFTPTTENGLTEEQKESAKNEVVNEAKVIELAEKQATCVHEFDENGVCTKCGLKQALTDAKLVEQGYVVRVVGGDGYMSLAEGMLALHENDTLKVLQDITLTSQTTNGLSAQKCIIDLNGKTITASGTWKLSKTVYEYMTYEDFLELGWGTPTKEEYDADPYPLGMTENPVDVTIMNGTYVVNGTGSGRIRFEKGSTGHFENVIIKSSSDTKTYQGLQTYACNDDGKIEKNLYSFTDCSFENVYLGFEGSAGSCNRYDISFKDCSFDSTTSDNGYNQIYIDDYNYGDLSIDGCQFNLVGNASGGAANCFYIDTYLSYVSGRIVNVTVVDSTFKVFKNANPYSQRFMSYNSVYMDNSSIDISNSTFTKDGKAVEPAIKEQTATNKSLVWVSNAEDFIACYAEWLSYVKSSPACASYSSLNYYLVECNGHYFVMGQGQQYASTAVITMEDDTVVQVLTRLSYGTTYNTIGTTDISSELGENDNANVHIYTLAK